MFGIGDTELLLIIVFAFLLFGPDKLPAMGRTIGKGLRQFRNAQDSVTKVVQTEVLDPMKQAANEGSSAAKAKAGVANEDADLDIEAVQQARTETFAERKARLAAEKAAKQAEADTAAAGAAAAAADAFASDAPVSGQEAAGEAAAAEAVAATIDPAAPSQEPEPEPEPEEDRRSVASLYGLAPKKPAPVADEDADTDAPATAGEEDGQQGA